MRIGNWPLLMLAVEHIIKHPDLHDQTKWTSTCGTYRCLAGWIAAFGGYRDVWYRNDPTTGAPRGVRLEGLTSFHDILDHETAALEALELDPGIYGEPNIEDRTDEAESLATSLFEGNLQLPDILEAVRDLARADGVTPTPLIVEKMQEHGVISTWEVA